MPELRGERHVRAEHLEVVGADGRDVDRVRDEAAFERRHHLLGDDHACAVLCLVRGRREMGCDDDVRRLQKRAAVRLLDVHVDRCARDLARLERRDQRRLVHELAAGRVDDAHAVPHLRDRRGVDRVARVVGERQVEGEEICARQHFLEARAVDAELAKALGGDERVIGDDLHLQPDRPPRDLPADAPEPEHAEHLVGELDAAPLRALPPAGCERRMGLRDVAREREEQADRVLGGRDDVRLGRVRDDDAAPRGRIDVDVVHPDAGAADHLQAAWRARSDRR